MRLSQRILLALATTLLPIMALWAMLFYYAMVREINDEADDSLEQYATLIITRCREGRPLPQLNSGSNNSYTIEPISDAEARPYLRATFHDETFYIPEKRETEPARVMTKAFLNSDNRYLLLKVATPTFEKEDLRETILWWTVILFAVLVVVVIIVATLSIRRTLRPLYALLRWLDGYTPGQKHSNIPNNTDIKELRRLNEAAQSAVERSEELLDRQKQFIGNASHELQTPLAVISNRVEHLINNTKPTAEQLDELVKIDRSLRHSIRLNRTLLQLTRIDSGEVAESTNVDIVELLTEAVDNCRDIYGTKSITCTITLPDNLYIYVDEALARMLVMNLTKNAFVHSAPHSHIDISIAGKQLRIANDGTEALDRSRVFDRFYTKSIREGSTGLGLAIVKSICDHYGYDIEYRYVDNCHTFMVTFK